MEDLLAKFYGKPKSEGSTDAPRPDESAAQLEPDPQLEQRVSLVETQLLQIAKAQQTILSRLDTMIEQQESQQAPPPAPKQQQEPPPVPRQAWRPAWKEPRPEPPPEPQYEWPPVPPTSHPEPDESIGDGEGTPILWDSVHQTLQTMDDASEDDPWQQELEARRERWAKKPKRTCASCGRRIPLRNLRTANSVWGGPETLVCPRCYEEHKQQVVQKKVTIGAVVFGIVVLLFIAANA